MDVAVEAIIESGGICFSSDSSLAFWIDYEN